jgi:sister-chromatid-cohesion protein PDS5
MYALRSTGVPFTDWHIIQTISEDLKGVDDEKLLAHVTVLAELAQKAPDAFESKSEDIMNFVVKQILMSPSPRDPVRFPSAFLFL